MFLLRETTATMTVYAAQPPYSQVHLGKFNSPVLGDRMYAVHKPRSVHISRQRAQSGDRSPTPREARVADRRVECLVSRHWDYCLAVFSREDEQSSRPLFAINRRGSSA